jgi:hypothetical protein
MSDPVALCDPFVPRTATVRRALSTIRDQASVADLLFLERWEIAPLPGAAAALRVSQIRRANPQLAAELRAEVTRAMKQGPALRTR